jgi:predicted acetyltransferase
MNDATKDRVSDVTLVRASIADALMLSRLLDLYLAEIGPLFELTPNADGRFEYPYLDLYWQQPDDRFAYLIRVDEEVAGFVLVTRGSPATGDPDDLDVAEFFVLPSYRRGAVGQRAAHVLWDRQPGHWIVRVAEGNDGAEAFWRATIAAYATGGVREGRYRGRSRLFRVYDFRSRPLTLT